jgi:tetratricopeptide (TPR) repeat protein
VISRLFLIFSLLWATPALSADVLLEGTEDEQAALGFYDQGKHIEAREKATFVLATNPRSFIGTFVMAAVYFHLEANLPRALFTLRKAMKQLEDLYGVPPSDPAAEKWHRRLLKVEGWILSDMDDRQGQIENLDRYNALYKPRRDVEYMWPLLKLRRYDEAVAIGKKLIYSDNTWERRRAYNGLMAVEDERRRRKASYEWGLAGYENTQGKSCIINSNLGLASRRAFRLDEAERFDKEALKTEDGTCPTSPYAQLTTVYLIQGEFQKSLSALEELRKVPRTPDERIQNEMTIKGRLVELLYALGQLDEAVQRTTEIMRQPDRAGTTSASPESIELANAVLHWAALDARLEVLRERAAVRPLKESFEIWNEIRGLLVERWQTRRLAIRLSTLDELLVDTVSPYYSDVMPWYAGAMIEMLGPGLVTKVVTVARARDVDFPKESNGFYDYLLGELAWRAGQWDEAIRLAGQALDELPTREVSLRWRIQAWLADSLWHVGQTQQARRHWHEVLRSQPAVFRHLALALPVHFEVASGALGERAHQQLRQSPRFTSGDTGFGVRIAQVEGALQICLFGEGGFQYACHVAEKIGENSEEALVKALDDFHGKAFSPKLELTQKDINSLDGRAVRQGAADAIKGLLDKEDR